MDAVLVKQLRATSARVWPRIARALLLVALLLVVTGCTTRFLYNQLDWFITWRINSYFSLDKEQEERLRESVERNLEWVRVEKLPQFAELLRAADRDIATREVTSQQFDVHFQDMVGLWDDFLRHVVPDAAAFLSDLSPEQVEILIANLDDENEEFREEYSGDTLEKRLKRREKAIIKNTQRFTGRLNDEQKVLIRDYVSRLHDNSEEWLKGRRAWQLEFRELLLESPPQEQYAERLLAMSLDPNWMDSPDYRERVEENRWLMMELYAELFNGLEDKQAARLSRRLNRFADDFDGIAADAG
ncbi:MAG: DUF6279 family lipoprotein [Gammaproteobacteria bacterium]|nr:DUF6279 family lipoprotein [Gammaproteobacteria bacterium]